MLTRQGEVKVADLGLAKSTAQDTTVTADGLGIGTPAYMSPEQSRGAKDVDCRADIYSLGITLFQMLTGHLPFKADSGFALVAAHLEQPLPDPRSLNPEMPQAVCELVRRMCVKKPGQRYQTPAELIQAIDGILETGAPGAAPRTQIDEFREQRTAVATQYGGPARESRFPVSAILGVVLAVLVVVGGGYLLVGKRPTAPPVTTTTTTVTTVPPAPVSEAQKAFDEAVAYAAAHPDDFQAIIAQFEEVKVKAKDKALAGKAVGQIEEWQKKWKEAADAEFQKRKATADTHLQAKAYDKAKAAWQGFPDNLRTETVEAKIAGELGRLKEAMKSFAEDLRKRAAPLLAKKPEELTEADVKALGALKTQADQAPAGLDEEAKVALEAVKDDLEAALDGYQQHLAAKRAEAFEKFWRVYEGLMKGRKFDEAAGYVEKSGEKLEAKARAVLTKDTPLVKDLLAKARENLPQLKGKAVRIGSMMMAVSDVKDGKVYVKQEGAEMAWEMEKLDGETIFALAFGPEAAPNLVLRQKALHIFYYGATNEAGKAMKAAAEAGEDVELYLSRMTPVLVITSSPPGAEVELEVMKDGGWQKLEAGALKTPMRKEVSPNGTYRVSVEKEGYLGADREVKVGVAGESAASFILKKAPAWPPFRDGLVLYYSFDEAGDRVQDLSGKGNHGTVHGATWTAKGKVGGAYEFDGRTTFVSRDYDDRSALFAQNPPLSVAAWFKTSSQAPPAQSVLGTHCAGRPDGYFLTVKCGPQWGGDFHGEIEAAFGGGALSKAPVNDGRWHHAVGTWDGEQQRLFVDGVAQGSSKSRPTIPYASRPPFHVGHIPNAPPTRDGDYYFQGTIDEVMVFRRVLSGQEARQLWKSSSGQPTGTPAGAKEVSLQVREGLVAYYPLDGDAEDKSKWENHGQVNGAVPVKDRFGRENGALCFDGKASEVVIPDSEALGTLSGFTLAVWAKDVLSGTIASQGGWCAMLAGQDKGISLVFRIGDEGRPQFLAVGGKEPRDPYNYFDAQQRIPADGNWHLLAAVFDRGEPSLFLDGRRMPGTVTYYTDGGDGKRALPATAFQEMLNSTDLVRIGSMANYCQHQGHARVGQFLRGNLDDLAIYDRALTEKEIRALASLKGPEL
jgi:tetratricopeptide (TPR) repeat protein